MVKFFKEIEEFREVVTISKGIKIEAFTGSCNYALDRFLKPWLGSDFIEAALAAYAIDPLAARWVNVIPLIQNTLANFTFVRYIPIGQVVVDAGGISRKKNANFESAYTNQINQLLAEHYEQGYNNLETLLEYLEENKADFPEWTTSDQYLNNKQYFINSFKEFESVYPIMRGRYTFTNLLPVIGEVEMLEIAPELGEYFAELKQSMQDDDLSAKEKTMLVDLKKAIVYFTIAASIQKHWIKLTHNSVVFTEHDKDTNHILETAASNTQASFKIEEARKNGNAFLSRSLNFIKANLDDFPTFRDDENVNPPEEDCTTNDPLKPKSFFLA